MNEIAEYIIRPDKLVNTKNTLLLLFLQLKCCACDLAQSAFVI